MEEDLERLVKEKEQETPMEVIPMSAIPLTEVSIASATVTAKISSATPV
jgi:hypothetical protein